MPLNGTRNGRLVNWALGVVGTLVVAAFLAAANTWAQSSATAEKVAKTEAHQSKHCEKIQQAEKDVVRLQTKFASIDTKLDDIKDILQKE